MPFDPEVPQSAREAAPIPFDQALQELVAALMEGGAMPQEAVATAEKAAATADPRTSLRQPRVAPQRAQVGAGPYGLPSIPPIEPNRLAGEISGLGYSPEVSALVEAGLPLRFGPAAD